MRALLTWVAVLVGVFVWRSGRSVKHSLLIESKFPVGYYAAGDFKTQCETVTESSNALKYCEDATFWDIIDASGKLEERRVLVTCDPNRKAWNTVMGPLRDPEPKGGLWVYSPGPVNSQATTGSRVNPQRLTLANYPTNHDFHPLGLEISPSHSGNNSNLFVVNHARHRTTIEQFVLSPSSPTTATHVRTLTSPYFISPNAVALTSPTSFYVTNDHLLTRRLPSPLGHILPMTETILGLPFGWLAHVSLEPNTTSPSGPPTIVHSFAAFGIPFANGVAISPDGKQLALATTTLSQIYFYSRSPSNNTLQHTHSVPVPFSPDNIMYDDSGALIVTGHPHFPSLISVAANKTDAFSPSWVLSISPRAAHDPAVDSSAFTPSQAYDLQAPISASAKAPAVLSHEVNTLFQSNGVGFSSSSTSLHDSTTGILYVFGLYAEGMMVCKP